VWEASREGRAPVTPFRKIGGGGEFVASESERKKIETKHGEMKKPLLLLLSLSLPLATKTDLSLSFLKANKTKQNETKRYLFSAFTILKGDKGKPRNKKGLTKENQEVKKKKKRQ
jgi:hypothetical protein